MNLYPGDPRLTAYVLGELQPVEAAAIEEAVWRSSKLQAAVSELRGLQENLVFELVVEPELELTHKQRKNVLAAGRSSLVASQTVTASDLSAGGVSSLPESVVFDHAGQDRIAEQGASRVTSPRTVIVSALVAACVAVSVSFLTQWLQGNGDENDGPAISFEGSNVPGFREGATLQPPEGLPRSVSPEMHMVAPRAPDFVPPGSFDHLGDIDILIPEIRRFQDLLDDRARSSQLGWTSEISHLQAPAFPELLPRGERNPHGFGIGYAVPEPPDDFEGNLEALPGEDVPIDRDYQWTGEFSKSYIPPFVDSVSYPKVRRHLQGGKLPPRADVHVEEMVNFFDYASPGFRDGIFGINLETAVAPWNSAHRLVRIVVDAKAPESARGMAPRNYVFLIDTAHVMRTPARLGMLSESAGLLVETLGERDHVTIFTYDGLRASLVAGPLPGSEKMAIANAFLGIHRANREPGTPIKLAYRAAQQKLVKGGDNRVIILTDRNVTAGAGSGSALVELAKLGRQHHTSLTIGTIGNIGGGTLDAELLTKLKIEADVSCAYLGGAADASRFFGSTLARPAVPLASKLEVMVDFSRDVVRSFRLIGFSNRPIDATAPQVAPVGEVHDGYMLSALYEVIPIDAPVEPLEMATEISLFEREARSLVFQQSEDIGAPDFELTLKYHAIGDKLPQRRRVLAPLERKHWSEASADFQFSAAVAGYGMMLRDSRHRGDADTDRLLELAEPGLRNDPWGLRREFVELLRASGKTP